MKYENLSNAGITTKEDIVIICTVCSMPTMTKQKNLKEEWGCSYCGESEREKDLIEEGRIG